MRLHRAGSRGPIRSVCDFLATPKAGAIWHVLSGTCCPWLAYLSVCEPLAFGTFHDQGSTFRIFHPEALAGVHAEIELGEIARQMGRADVMIGANQAALHEAEIPLSRIGMDRGPIALSGAGKRFVVVYSLMTAKRHHALVELGTVRVQDAVGV